MQNNFIHYNTIPSLSIQIGVNQDRSSLLEDNICEIQKIIEDLKKIEKNRTFYSVITGASLLLLSFVGFLIYFGIQFIPNRNQQTKRYNQYPINFSKTCGDYFPVKEICEKLDNFNDPKNSIGFFCKQTKENLCGEFSSENTYPIIFLSVVTVLGLIIIGSALFLAVYIPGSPPHLEYLENINKNIRDHIITLAVKYSLTEKEPFAFDHPGNFGTFINEQGYLVDNNIYRRCKLKDIRIKFEEKLIELQNTHKSSNDEEVITIESNEEAIIASEANTNVNPIPTVGRFNTFGLFSEENINPLPLSENDSEQHFPSPHLHVFEV